MLCVALGSLRGWQVYYGMSGKFAVESVATFAWNERQLSHGISGNFRMESVATFAWNRWQLSRGIRSHRSSFACQGEQTLAPPAGAMTELLYGRGWYCQICVWT